jgi:PilZ domain-containing protein
MTTERRRDVRTRITVPAAILRRGSAEPVHMVDASFRGLFLRMDDPPPVRELIKLRINLPSGHVVMHAVVMRIVDDEIGRAGVGLRFFVLEGQDKREWESFIAFALSAARRAA